jgi:hypothetical protein
MLHAGLDLSRRKVDVCLLASAGEIVDECASPPDADGPRGLAARAATWPSPSRRARPCARCSPARVG